MTCARRVMCSGSVTFTTDNMTLYCMGSIAIEWTDEWSMMNVLFKSATYTGRWESCLWCSHCSRCVQCVLSSLCRCVSIIRTGSTLDTTTYTGMHGNVATSEGGIACSVDQGWVQDNANYCSVSLSSTGLCTSIIWTGNYNPHLPSCVTPSRVHRYTQESAVWWKLFNSMLRPLPLARRWFP